MNSRVFEIIEKEQARQDETVELIASENFVSQNVLKAQGSCLTNKYAEGHISHRHYSGCECCDELESYCAKKWQEVFKTDYHVNVQPYSGSIANYEVYLAVLNAGDTILSMDADNGGHITHGDKENCSGKFYKTVFYSVDSDGFLKYDEIREKLYECNPKLLICGASAYPRVIDFKRIRSILDEYNAKTQSNCLMMTDMSHIAGLIAAGVHPSPFGISDIVTSTTHKTLRGARGGMIFCKKELAKAIDAAVFPGTQGGPLMHVIAGKAVAAEEASEPAFVEYIKNVVANTKAMANRFTELGYKVVTDGTDNHLFLLDFSKNHPDVTGKAVEEKLEEHKITTNKISVPCDKRAGGETCGLRIGCAAMTTKGWKAEDFIKCADRIDKIIKTEL